jgi:nitroreductase
MEGEVAMEIDELLTLMRQRRSVRDYKSDPVPQEYIDKILEAGRWAPSSANSQPWDFIVIKDKAVKQGIHNVILDVIDEIKTLRDFPFLRTFRAEYIIQAPVNIVVCGDPRFTKVSIMDGVDPQMEDFSFWGSVTLPIQNMLLAAQCLGLGSVVFTDIRPDRLKALLDVPDPLKVICVLPIGFPAETPEPRFRRDLSHFTHQDHFDKSKMRPESFVTEARMDPSKLFLKRGA